MKEKDGTDLLLLMQVFGFTGDKRSRVCRTINNMRRVVHVHVCDEKAFPGREL